MMMGLNKLGECVPCDKGEGDVLLQAVHLK